MHFRIPHAAGAMTIAGLVALAGASPAGAQNDLLRGPEAREQGPPGAPRDFAPGDRRDMRDPTPAMRHRLLMGAIRALERTSEVALTGDQRAAIEAQHRLYAAALKAHRDANAEAYEALRPDEPRRDRRRAGAELHEDEQPRRDAPRGRRPMDPDEREQMRAERRERMQALRALELAAPSPDEIHANIWSLLDPEQRRAVEQRMDRLRARAMDRARAPQGERAGDDMRLTDQQRRRIRRAMEDMTPEERRAFLERVRERLGRQRHEERPAPPMEEVDVPPPGA